MASTPETGLPNPAKIPDARPAAGSARDRRLRGGGRCRAGHL